MQRNFKTEGDTIMNNTNKQGTKSREAISAVC